MARSYVRKPSVRKSVSARTTGRATRAVKSAVNPAYGKKGMGVINDPRKAAYNKAYSKTSVGINGIVFSVVGFSFFMVFAVAIYLYNLIF